MMNEFNPDGKDIRFIDSHYRDLFRIPDGGTIQVHYSDDSVVIKPCKFIDEYHTQIGNNVFHICQFAELLERNGSYCQAEPEIMGDEAAWQVGRDQYLAKNLRSGCTMNALNLKQHRNRFIRWVTLFFWREKHTISLPLELLMYSCCLQEWCTQFIGRKAKRILNAF